MGFYHPSTILKDAQRHGLKVRPIDVACSGWLCAVEDGPKGEKCVRLGLRYVRGLREEAGRAIVRERQRTPFCSIANLARRVPELRKDEMRRLAQVGALNFIGKVQGSNAKVQGAPEESRLGTLDFGLWTGRQRRHRRGALWQAERAAQPAGPLLEDLPEPDASCPLAPMQPEERTSADFRGTGLTLGPHPMWHRRAELNRIAVLRAGDLRHLPNGRPVRVAGCVIARQRPGTAKGFLFLSLEDETGIANLIVDPDLFERNRLELTTEPFLLIDGALQNQDGVVSVKARRVQALLRAIEAPASHDFR